MKVGSARKVPSPHSLPTEELGAVSKPVLVPKAAAEGAEREGERSAPVNARRPRVGPRLFVQNGGLWPTAPFDLGSLAQKTPAVTSGIPQSQTGDDDDKSVRLNLPFEPNADALEAAKKSAAGKSVLARTPDYADVYREASAKTGVPAALLAAVHVNESTQGANTTSTLGPESGFGLDPRSISTAEGNRILKEHKLGTWERGKDTPRSRLQSAVIAAEHLKKTAKSLGVEMGPDMTKNDLAALIAGYTTGGRAAARAKQRGRTWMLDTADPNPHPRHPGGTSVGPGGRKIRVKPSRKKGLLRWDVLLPMLEEQLRKPKAAQPGVA